MAHTKQETLSQLNSILITYSFNDFYKHCPYRKGKLKRDNIFSDEYVALFVLENLDQFESKINKDNRTTYFDKPREEKTGEGEEQFQRFIYFEGNLDADLKSKLVDEEFIWFEFSGYPKIGKGIDLISYNSKKKILTIYELKYGVVNEHLIKAILEIQTYFKRTRFNKLKNDWKINYKNANKPTSHYEKLDLVFDNAKVRKVLLLDKRSFAARQLLGLEGDNKNQLKLLDILSIETIVFDGEKYPF